MKLYHSVFCITLSLLFSSSCKKDESKSRGNPCGGQPSTSYLAEDLLNCRYKTGTYWIFIDSISNSSDSIYITSYKQEFLKAGPCEIYYESHSYSTMESLASKTIDYVVVPGGLFKSPNGVNTGTQIYDNYKSQEVSHLDSIFIFDRYYKNVVKTTVLNDPTEADQKSSYYINSEFGFLRKDIYDSTNNLISRKLLKKKVIVR